MVVILQSRPQILSRCTTASNSQQYTLGLMKYRGAKGQSASHRPLLSGHPSYVVALSLSRSLSYFVLTCPLLIHSYLPRRSVFLIFYNTLSFVDCVRIATLLRAR
ncbi:hypothetical protein N7517_011289 [Penicillium concentricum]|uniref:Uncharacterized protein n=1 Tax=Penicillium concentricum TaxID=293559 RepID=A0A9W9UV88_9EURO|nr:uncharacterized protein N7517_011289 [Penicillium concentricum]KAJ5356680.1 hypothetical protein N7517_011289 [Penicillium concentricum]